MVTAVMLEDRVVACTPVFQRSRCRAGPSQS